MLDLFTFLLNFYLIRHGNQTLLFIHNKGLALMVCSKVVLYTTSVAGVFTASDFFPSPCTLEVGEVVPEIPTLK